MTRGFVIVINNNNEISEAVYSNSDSYFSGLGMAVLEYFEKKDISSLIQNLLDEDEDLIKETEGIEWDWIEKQEHNSENFFVDYTYTYNKDKDTVTIYYCGTKAFTIKRPQIEVCRYIFENEEMLYRKMGFNKKLMKYDYPWYKFINTALRKHMSIEDLKQAQAELIDAFYMEEGRISDFFRKSDFYKKVIDVDTQREIRFRITPTTFSEEKRDVYIQTPFGSALIKGFVSNDKSAERCISKTIREERRTILNLMKILEYVNDYQDKLDKYMFIKKNYSIVDENSKKNLEETVSNILDFKKENPIIASNSHAFKEKTIRAYLETLRQKMLKSEDIKEE